MLQEPMMNNSRENFSSPAAATTEFYAKSVPISAESTPMDQQHQNHQRSIADSDDSDIIVEMDSNLMMKSHHKMNEKSNSFPENQVQDCKIHNIIQNQWERIVHLESHIKLLENYIFTIRNSNQAEISGIGKFENNQLVTTGFMIDTPFCSGSMDDADDDALFSKLNDRIQALLLEAKSTVESNAMKKNEFSPAYFLRDFSNTGSSSVEFLDRENRLEPSTDTSSWDDVFDEKSCEYPGLAMLVKMCSKYHDEFYSLSSDIIKSRLDYQPVFRSYCSLRQGDYPVSKSKSSNIHIENDPEDWTQWLNSSNGSHAEMLFKPSRIATRMGLLSDLHYEPKSLFL